MFDLTFTAQTVSDNFGLHVLPMNTLYYIVEFTGHSLQRYAFLTQKFHSYQREERMLMKQALQQMIKQKK